MAAKSGATASRLSYKEVSLAIKEERIKPVYLLWGEEAFLIADLIKRLKQALLDPAATELDFSLYDAEGYPSRIDWIQLRNVLSTPPFLSKKRVILVKNSGLFKGSVNLSEEQNSAMEACLSHQATWACLVFKEDKVDKRVKKLLKLIEEHGAMVELGRMDAAGLLGWIAASLKRFEIRISKMAADSLIDRCEFDMYRLSNELSKLRLYAESQGLHEIGQKEIELIASPDLRGGIFDLTAAFAEGNSAKALRLYRNLRQNREAGTFILFMLARHIRQLACARSAKQEAVLSPFLKISPYGLRRLFSQGRRFSDAQLAEMYALCKERDRLIKWGRMDEEIALESLIVALASGLR